MVDVYRYRKLGRRLACANRLFEVFFDTVETPSGEIVDNFLVVRPKLSAPKGIVGVCVLPEVNGKIGLMRGWRHQLEEEVWQAPAGFIDLGETAKQTAVRELKEETALVCDPTRLQSLGLYLPDAGLIEGRVALFHARCEGPFTESATTKEIGTGPLEYFSPDALEEILNHAEHIGGATLVAGYRYLRWHARKSQPQRREEH